MIRIVLLLTAGSMALGCTLGRSSTSPAPTAQPESTAPAKRRAKTHAAKGIVRTDVATAAEPTPVVRQPSSPQQIERAKVLVRRGIKHYRNGDYDRAEGLLKQAVTLYPFIAEANLALGKILLIRGSATRDRAMIANARLMFEMARAVDPSLREIEMLLELFTAAEE